MSRSPSTPKGWHKSYLSTLGIKKMIYAREKHGLDWDSPMEKWTDGIKKDIRDKGYKGFDEIMEKKHVEKKLKKMAGF